MRRLGTDHTIMTYGSPWWFALALMEMNWNQAA